MVALDQVDLRATVDVEDVLTAGGAFGAWVKQGRSRTVVRRTANRPHIRAGGSTRFGGVFFSMLRFLDAAVQRFGVGIRALGARQQELRDEHAGSQARPAHQ